MQQDASQTPAAAQPAVVPAPGGGYLHRFQSLTALESPDDGDMQVVARGAIAITPLRLDLGGMLPRRLQAALEKTG